MISVPDSVRETMLESEVGNAVSADSVTFLNGVEDGLLCIVSSAALIEISTSTVSLNINVTLPESISISHCLSEGLVVSAVKLETFIALESVTG